MPISTVSALRGEAGEPQQYTLSVSQSDTPLHGLPGLRGNCFEWESERNLWTSVRLMVFLPTKD